jgi:hypothetical protein
MRRFDNQRSGDEQDEQDKETSTSHTDEKVDFLMRARQKEIWKVEMKSRRNSMAHWRGEESPRRKNDELQRWERNRNFHLLTEKDDYGFHPQSLETGSLDRLSMFIQHSSFDQQDD